MATYIDCTGCCAFSSSTLYPRLELAAAIGGATAPSGFLKAWSQGDSNYSGANAKRLSFTPGTSQQSAAKSDWTAITGASLGCAQFLSPRLAGQTITNHTLALAFAASLANATVGPPERNWGGSIGFYLVNGSTGAIRTTIISASWGSAARTSTSELVCDGGTGVYSFTPTAGDYLCLELGLAIVSVGKLPPTFTPQTAVYTSGTTTLGSDGASASDAKSIVADQSGNISYI